ncbi:unconventional myosin-XVIIIa-like isoform X2 [Macrobrachium rosenbergii]|uniref:unconventional myosin-XVIIIa-like isoform X2 n=1 Tax=Macrobrachium rosenbergii TaxID=79674 RepID=UPI0034D73F07
MPSPFDLFGPFENSLRTYHKPQFRTKPCPNGIHIPENCTCDPNHECRRPHCANDVPLDPLSRLTIGTPFGPMTSITESPSTHKCRSAGCSPSPPPPTTPTKAPSAFSLAVIDRLYTTRTHASSAKMKSSVCGGGGRGSSPSGRAQGMGGDTIVQDYIPRDDGSSDDSGGGGINIGGKAGTRLISQLIGDRAVGSHDHTRRDGASPSPTRRAHSIGAHRSASTTNALASCHNSRNSKSEVRGSRKNGYPTRRSQSSHAAIPVKVRLSATPGAISKHHHHHHHHPHRMRTSESDASSSEFSSPETSPGSTPTTTPLSTPRKVLSPKNSGAQLLPAKTFAAAAAAKRSAAKCPYARPSAVFCGSNGRGKIKPTPLNKSASDGGERFRSSVGMRSVKGSERMPIFAKSVQVGCAKRIVIDDILKEEVRSKLARVSSDSRVDELLAQAHMALESLTPEPQNGGAPVLIDRTSSSCSPGQDSLRRLAIAHARKENGKSYKDLTQILQEKIEELDDALARSEEQVAAAKAWLDAERVWLVHRGGFCAARQLRETDSGESLPEGRVRLKLEHNGDIIEVDEDDVEKANPPPYDRCEDLAQLRYLNESSVLHTLRQRYGSNLIHTYAGTAMVVINPTSPLAIYSEKVIQMFKGCKLEDMPPHIYSAAQASYRDLLATRRDQSIVFLGRSGAGKTTNFRHVLHYLALAAGTTNKILTVEKLNAISTLLEAFGNSRTVMNTNATRFTQIFSLDFDHSGQIASASVQVYMPEKTRVVRRPEGEPNYHIFYQLLSGADNDLRRTLGLDKLSEPNLFMTPLQRSEDRQKAGIAWARIRAALDVLGVSPDEQHAIWSVLAAIYHLGTAGAVKASTNKFQFNKPGSAQRAATLLGTSVEELARSIFYANPTTPSTRASFSALFETFDDIMYMIRHAGGDGDRTASPTERPTERPEGLEALEGMATGLYSEAFNAIVALINRCISTSAHTSNSILVVDAPGFQNPASCGRTSGATFQDLCHNYTQERFQMLFHDTTFTAQTDRYAQENIEFGDVADEIGTPAPLIALIDKASSNCVVRTSQIDLKEADRRGLLWLLDEEAIFPGASDQSFLERLYAHYGDREYSQLLKKGQAPDQFILQHFQGTNPVTYSIHNWLKASRENPVMRQAAALLQESNKETLSRLFVFSRGPVSNTISGSVVGIEGSQSLRRASSIRRAFTTGTAGIKRKSVCLQVKFTVDGIIETLRRSKLRFVHCLLPQHNAGLCDLKSSLHLTNKANNSCEDILLNVPLVRSQLRGCQILDALRLHKQGFPEHLQYSEFRRRFAVLAPAEARAQAPVLDERAAVEAILAHLDLDSSSYRLGLSQIFFRTGAISRLEEQRDLVLADQITHFQAHCRGYLARKRLEKRKVQETAIRCIQKNVRKFMGVRDWPWWRLLVRVTPLLNVHRTEEELRATKDELEILRARLDKVEKERGHLKHENDKLEARLSEVTADLSEEHTTAHLAGERLEAEQAERMKLEKEIDRLQTDVKRMTTANGKLEMEKLVLRSEVLSAAELNGDIDDDEAADASLYKRKYEWCLREIELLKKQSKQQQEDDLDQLLLLKKQLEKKVADAYEETDEQRQVVAQLKRKCQRLQAEMNDLKILLEEQTSRNNLLEKKQRKFDQEVMSVQEELRHERSNKDKIQRERDQILSEKYSFEQEVTTLKLELELKEEKVAALNRELDDLTSSGKVEEEVATLKKAKHDLELRIKDQEEELDDLAGQVQMLEGAKVRLEMSMEQMRKENRREISQREEELEEIRLSAQKKVKSLEAQLENEHEERTLLVREKHELERRITDLQDRTITHVDEDYVHKLKKELKKTKALLRDTQTMLEKAQSEGSHKLILRQLKTQLEDAEFAKTAALKARQCAESDLADVSSQLDEALRAKKESEDKCARVNKEKAEIQTQIEESEEELAEVMKKYKAVVSQLSVDQITLSEQSQQIAELEHSKQVLQERMMELSSKVEVLEGETANIHTQRRLEMKIKEIESKLELELTTRQRLESQIGRLKDQIERLSGECDAAKMKESQALDQSKRLTRQLRDAKEDLSNMQQRYTEAVNKKSELEKQLELSDAEVVTLKSDLKLAFKRIEDLQQAIQGDISDSDSELSDSDSDSDGSLSSYLTASLKHQRSSSNSTLRTPPSEVHQLERVSFGSETRKNPKTETCGAALVAN